MPTHLRALITNYHTRPRKTRLSFACRAEIAASIMIMVCCLAADVAAQTARNELLRYRPSTPTISPWLNLTQFNNGILPNYFSLVRPQMQQNAELRELYIRQQDFYFSRDEQRRLESGSLTSERTAITGSRAGFQVTGDRGRFQEFSHFYPPVEPQRFGRRR